jgi:hypothetical protein
MKVRVCGLVGGWGDRWVGGGRVKGSGVSESSGDNGNVPCRCSVWARLGVWGRG